MSFIRHPVLLVVEALALATSGGLVREGFRRAEARSQGPMDMTLAVLGENERADGSWEGVDLLRHPDRPAQRFQLSLRVERRARVSLDVVESEEVARLFPEEKREAVLEPGRWYALPSPRGFYELAGRVHLRLNVVPVAVESSGYEPADPVGPPSTVTFRLSDGAPFQTTRQAFEGRGATRLELHLRAP